MTCVGLLHQYLKTCIVYQIPPNPIIHRHVLETRNINLLYHLSFVYFNIRDYELSIQLLDECLKLDACYGSAYYLYGKIYAIQGNTDRAIEYLQSACRYNTYKALFELGEIYFNMGKYYTAVDYYKQILKTKSIDLPTRLTIIEKIRSCPIHKRTRDTTQTQQPMQPNQSTQPMQPNRSIQPIQLNQQMTPITSSYKKIKYTAIKQQKSVRYRSDLVELNDFDKKLKLTHND